MIDHVLSEAARELRAFGLIHWADRLVVILESANSERLKASEVLKLFGGFGTLNDIAFSDGDAPPGMTGEEATTAYFTTINALYRAAKSVAAQPTVQADAAAPRGLT